MKQPLFFKVFKDGKVIEIKQFTKPQVVIGREGEIDLMLNDPSVSPIHAIIEERTEGHHHVCDLGSQSGTVLNGSKVVDEEIRSGDTLVIGNLTIEFHIGIPKPKTAPPAAVVTPQAPKPEVKPPKIEDVEPDPMYSRGEETQIPKAVPEGPPKRSPTVAPVNNTATMAAAAAAAAAGAASAGTSAVASAGVSFAAPSRATYAPPSQVKNLHEIIKPGRGGVVELVVGWHDRVLTTYHFEKRQVVHIGSHPKNEVVLPTIGTVRSSHPLVKLDGATTVFFTTDMTGFVRRENNTSLSFDELKRKGSITASGGGFAYTLQQNEVIQINLGDGVSVWLRFVNNPPPTLLAPMLDLSLNQLTALMLGLIGIVLFLVYVFLYAPPVEPLVEEETEPPRRAQFVYKKTIPVAVEADFTSAAKVKADEQKGKQASAAAQAIKDKEVAKSREEEGAASEAAPNKSQSKEKKLTATKAGKDKGIKVGGGAKQPDAAAAASQKDVKNSGLLGVFGKSGIQEQLNRANEGTGMAGGVAKTASGSGSDSAGAGITPGAGMRDVGQGGTGTATVGIAGVNTKGRGGGLTGYGTGSIGGKRNATVLPGGDEATFTGTIDRDAIRRVVQANLKQIKACYEKGLNKDPGLYGKIVIQWTIGPGGRVMEAGTKTTTMNSPEVENCAVARLRTWKFPEPPADQVAVVSYPFVFQAQD